ncbi:MAG: 5-formyltetrahydrofolate cyclo-ligase [Gammaproteobacteria bacterium]
MIKSSIRKSILKRRLALSNASIENLSATIQFHLLESEYFLKANSIGLYFPVNNEVKTEKIIAACFGSNKKIFMPKIYGTNLHFISLKPDSSFVENKFGIPEINVKDEDIAKHIDLIICPGVSFDESKHRIGYGGSFYDRYLSKASFKYVGMLAFSMQFTQSIDAEEHDIAMNFVVTENGLLD